MNLGEGRSREAPAVNVLADLRGMLQQVVPGFMDSRALKEERNTRKCQESETVCVSQFPFRSDLLRIKQPLPATNHHNTSSHAFDQWIGGLFIAAND